MSVSTCVVGFVHADSEAEVTSEATPQLETEKSEEQPAGSAVRTRIIPNNKRCDLLSTLHSVQSIKVNVPTLVCLTLTHTTKLPQVQTENSHPGR